MIANIKCLLANVWDFISAFWAIISTVWAAVSTSWGIWEHYYRKKIEFEKKTMTWDDFDKATTALAKKLEKSISPSCIVFSPDPIGGYIAWSILEKLGNSIDIPIYVGVKASKGSNKRIDSDNFTLAETTKWKLWIPSAVFSDKNKTVYIIHDLVMSGDYLVELRNVLHSKGITDIVSVSLITSDISIETHKVADLYWKTYSQREFYFPWGKAK